MLGDITKKLPFDVWRLIFGYLDTRELTRLSEVCKNLKDVSERDALWKPIYEKSAVSSIWMKDMKKWTTGSLKQQTIKALPKMKKVKKVNDFHVKIFAVGEASVGKTCMFITHCTKNFPLEYVPTVFDNYAENVMVQGHVLVCSYWDNADMEYKDMRRHHLHYYQTDVFLFCFSVVDRHSLQKVWDKWIPETLSVVPKAKKVLVGLKRDLRNDPSTLAKLKEDGAAPISTKEGISFAQKNGMDAYIENSSLMGEGLEMTFKLCRVMYVNGYNTREKKETKKETCVCF